MSFVERHGIWTGGQAEAATEAEHRIAAGKIEIVRLSFADQHGILRGKSVVSADAAKVMRNGCAITTTLLAKDTAHRTVFPVFTAGGSFGMREMEGAADTLMVAHPTTFRMLPWAPRTGWMLCDLYFADGRLVPLSTRHRYRIVLQKLAAAGYDFMAGLEVEFHVFKLLDPRLRPGDSGQPGEPPDMGLLTLGYQYLTEQRYDQFDPVFEILRGDIAALGLKLRSLELEYGPSQCELTFHPGIGLEPADAMVLLRSAVKQIARRHGYHASFMCRPRIPNVMSSGWHLHQSLRDRRSGDNAFVSNDDCSDLSSVALHWLAGLLTHARAATAFATATLNGYKRYRPYSLAQDRATWGRDNRGVMIRALATRGDRRRGLKIGLASRRPTLTCIFPRKCWPASTVWDASSILGRRLIPPMRPRLKCCPSR
jgi:glutamine synthetase